MKILTIQGAKYPFTFGLNAVRMLCISEKISMNEFFNKLTNMAADSEAENVSFEAMELIAKMGEAGICEGCRQQHIENTLTGFEDVLNALIDPSISNDIMQEVQACMAIPDSAKKIFAPAKPSSEKSSSENNENESEKDSKERELTFSFLQAVGVADLGLKKDEYLEFTFYELMEVWARKLENNNRYYGGLERANYDQMRIQTSCLIAMLTGKEVSPSKIIGLEGDAEIKAPPKSQLNAERIQHLIKAYGYGKELHS